MLTLYWSPGASSMAPHIALHEIGAPFEAKPVLIPKGEHKRPEYLAINPEGKIPTFMIDGRVMTEVAAILWYLARHHPEAGLLPAGDIEAEAQIISWMSFCASTLHPARRAGVERWREVFGLAEKKLGGREWAVDRYSIADIHLFRLFWRFVDSEHPAPGTYPGLYAHYQRMMARPAVQRTLAIEQAVG
jgi:glutathione S-transferase